MKTCTKCGETKPLSKFHKDASKRDGLRSHCNACISIKNAAWRVRNSDRSKAYREEWYAKNLDKAKDLVARWRKNNQDKTKANRDKWYDDNPGARRTHAQNRRARKRANGGKLSPCLADKLFKLQRGKCACCHASIADGYHLDHRMPVALGGPNEDWNMQLLCAPCNLSKGAKHPVDFMQSMGLLL